MTLIRIGYAFRIRVNEQEKIVYDKLFQHHLSRGQATATQTTWPGLLLCSSCWPLTPSLQKGCLSCIPRTSPARRAQTTAMLWACSTMFPACKLSCTMNRHSLFLRWEKDKDNTVTEQKSSFPDSCLGAQSVHATENWSISKCFLGHPQNHFLQTLPFWPTWHALYSQYTQQTPKTPCLFTQRMRSPCNLDQQVRLNMSQEKRTKWYLPFKTILKYGVVTLSGFS